MSNKAKIPQGFEKDEDLIGVSPHQAQSQKRSTKRFRKLKGEYVMLYKKVMGILCLIQKQTLSSLSDLKSQKVMEITQVFKFKSLVELLDQNIKKFGIVPSEDKCHPHKQGDRLGVCHV